MAEKESGTLQTSSLRKMIRRWIQFPPFGGRLLLGTVEYDRSARLLDIMDSVYDSLWVDSRSPGACCDDVGRSVVPPAERRFLWDRLDLDFLDLVPPPW